MIVDGVYEVDTGDLVGEPLTGIWNGAMGAAGPVDASTQRQRNATKRQGTRTMHLVPGHTVCCHRLECSRLVRMVQMRNGGDDFLFAILQIRPAFIRRRHISSNLDLVAHKRRPAVTDFGQEARDARIFRSRPSVFPLIAHYADRIRSLSPCLQPPNSTEHTPHTAGCRGLVGLLTMTATHEEDEEDQKEGDANQRSKYGANNDALGWS